MKYHTDGPLSVPSLHTQRGYGYRAGISNFLQIASA